MPRDRIVIKRTKRDTTSQSKSLPKKLGKIPGMKAHTPSWAVRLNGVASTPEGPAMTSTGILDFRNDSPPVVPPPADVIPPSPRNNIDDGSPGQLPFAALLLSPTPTLPATPDPLTPSLGIYANNSANSSLDLYSFDPAPYQGDDALLPVMASLTPPVTLFPSQGEGSTSGHSHHVYGDLGSGHVDHIFQDQLALFDNSPAPHTWSLFQQANQENVADTMSPLDYTIHPRSFENLQSQSSYAMSAVDVPWPFPIPSSSSVDPGCNETTSPRNIFSSPLPISIPQSRRRNNHLANSPHGGAMSAFDSYEEAFWREDATHRSLHGNRFSPYGRRKGRSYEPSPSLEGTSALGLQFSASAPASTSQQLFALPSNYEFPSTSITAPVPVSASQFFPEVDPTFLSELEYWPEVNQSTGLQ